MAEWESFFVAELGASAVLMGLIFVGISINLTKVLEIPRLTLRGLEVLLLLFAVLVVCSLLLVPGQPVNVIGIEILAVGVAIWLTVLGIDVHVWRMATDPYRRAIPLLVLLNQLSVLPYIISGILILVQGELGGLYWSCPRRWCHSLKR